MKILLMFIFMFPIASLACAPGNYINDTGGCTICEKGYYCPDGEHKYNCFGTQIDGMPSYSDTDGAIQCTKCPESGIKVFGRNPDQYMYHYSDATPTAAISSWGCRAKWWIQSAHGALYEIGFNYHPDRPSSVLVGISSCDAGYWCPYCFDARYNKGYTDRYWFDRDGERELIEVDPCQPVGYGFYSVDDGTGRTACDAGYGTHVDNAADSNMCMPLCSFGGRRLHSGNLEFFIWPENHCATPALKIGFADGTCCVNLEQGPGGLNIDINGNVYHAVN